MIVSCPSCQRNYVVADDQIAGKQFRARCKSCGVEFRLDGMSTSRDASTPANKDEPAKFMSATEAFLSLRTAPPPTTGTWSVCLSKTDTRRMSTEEVVAAYGKGTISTNFLVWKSGMPKWLRLSEVPELMTALGNPVSKTTGGAGRSEPAPKTKSEAPERAVAPLATGNTGNTGNTGKSIKPRARTATLMGTGTPSARPVSSVAPRSGHTSPPPVPDMDSASAELRRSALSAPLMPTFGSKPPPNPDSLRRSIPAPPRRALDIPVEVEVDLGNAVAGAAPAGGDQQQVSNDGKLLPLALEPAMETREGTSSSAPPAAAGEENTTVQLQPEDAPAPPTSGKHPVESPSGIVLPPLTGSPADDAAVGSIEAAGSLVSAHARTESTSTNSVRPKTELGNACASEVGHDSKPSPSNHPERRSVAATDRDSDPSTRQRHKSRLAGMVIAMSAVGIVGVLGGVAGAVYVMKTAGVGQPAVSVVALQPQPAMPASAARISNSIPEASPAGPNVPESARSTEPSAAAIVSAPIAPATEKARSASHAQRGASYVASSKTVSKAASPAAEPVAASISTPAAVPAAAPAPAPATANGASSFNRDSAMAVLGLAASRAPTCKKPDGPKGTSKVHVTFDPSGSVIGANVAGGPLAGTSVAQCIAGIFRRIKVPPFAGERVTISRDVTIPP